jgi:isopentenyl-diphosphate delta-isomerase
MAIPVVVKEVGWGISAENAHRLIDAGVQAIDVAGAGGTSWSEVERHRANDEKLAETAAAFRNWGIPTAECLREIHTEIPDALLIASGGIHNGIEVAKCLALGASLVGMAGVMLRAAMESEAVLHQKIEVICGNCV